VISVDSRQVYRTLDIGTEKVSREEMRGVPHHLIDIRDPKETYSAGDFVKDATRLIKEIHARGKLPILVGGTHFYFDALLSGLPQIATNEELRTKLEELSTSELYSLIKTKDPRRAIELDPKNRRRLIRAIEIVEAVGRVPERKAKLTKTAPYNVEWIVMNPPKEELMKKIRARLQTALRRGLVEEVERVRKEVGDERLNELGLEYKIVGEYIRSERTRNSLLPTLSAKLSQYARRQKAWLRKLMLTPSY
jgi:tRNA dimethylallyltransferase